MHRKRDSGRVPHIVAAKTGIDDLFGDGEMLSMLGIDSVFEDQDEVMELTMLLPSVCVQNSCMQSY